MSAGETMLKADRRLSKACFWSLLGAYSAQFLGGICIWLVSVSPDFLPWFFFVYSFGAPLSLSIGASLISISLERLHRRINVFWLAFLGTMLSIPAAPLLDIFVLNGWIDSLHNPTLIRVYFVLIQTSSGFLIMGILTAISLILTRKREVRIKN